LVPRPNRRTAKARSAARSGALAEWPRRLRKAATVRAQRAGRRPPGCLASGAAEAAPASTSTPEQYQLAAELRGVGGPDVYALVHQGKIAMSFGLPGSSVGAARLARLDVAPYMTLVLRPPFKEGREHKFIGDGGWGSACSAWASTRSGPAPS
jgi:hypothetical protein